MEGGTENDSLSSLALIREGLSSLQACFDSSTTGFTTDTLSRLMANPATGGAAVNRLGCKRGKQSPVVWHGGGMVADMHCRGDGTLDLMAFMHGE